MKKFISLLGILLLAGMSVTFAQSFVLKDHNGTELKNDTLLKVNVPTLNQEVVLDLYLKNKSSKTKELGLKKMYSDVVKCDSSTNYFCFAGLCFMSTTMVSPVTTTLNAGATDSTFAAHYTYMEDIDCCSEIRYTFYDTLNVSDSVTIRVVWQYGTNNCHAGVNELADYKVKISNAYPNPAFESVSFDYQFENILNAELQIYNIYGALVSKHSLNNSNGKININTTDLNNGIYFYSFISDKGILSSGKFAVSK